MYQVPCMENVNFLAIGSGTTESIHKSKAIDYTRSRHIGAEFRSSSLVFCSVFSPNRLMPCMDVLNGSWVLLFIGAVAVAFFISVRFLLLGGFCFWHHLVAFYKLSFRVLFNHKSLIDFNFFSSFDFSATRSPLNRSILCWGCFIWYKKHSFKYCSNWYFVSFRINWKQKQCETIHSN